MASEAGGVAVASEEAGAVVVGAAKTGGRGRASEYAGGVAMASEDFSKVLPPTRIAATQDACSHGGLRTEKRKLSPHALQGNTQNPATSKTIPIEPGQHRGRADRRTPSPCFRPRCKPTT